MSVTPARRSVIASIHNVISPIAWVIDSTISTITSFTTTSDTTPTSSSPTEPPPSPFSTSSFPTDKSWMADSPSTAFVIHYSVERDLSALFRLVVGLFLILYAASRIASSRNLHITTGTIFGALAFFLLVGIILIRLLPRKRTLVFFSTLGFFGGILTLGGKFTRWILTEHAPWIAVGMVFGAITGFALSYKYKLDEDSQTLLRWFLKGIGICCLLTSSNNVMVSLAITIGVMVYSDMSAWANRVEESLIGGREKTRESLLRAHEEEERKWTRGNARYPGGLSGGEDDVAELRARMLRDPYGGEGDWEQRGGAEGIGGSRGRAGNWDTQGSAYERWGHGDDGVGGGGGGEEHDDINGGQRLYGEREDTGEWQRETASRRRMSDARGYMPSDVVTGGVLRGDGSHGEVKPRGCLGWLKNILCCQCLCRKKPVSGGNDEVMRVGGEREGNEGERRRRNDRDRGSSLHRRHDSGRRRSSLDGGSAYRRGSRVVEGDDESDDTSLPGLPKLDKIRSADEWNDTVRRRFSRGLRSSRGRGSSEEGETQGDNGAGRLHAEDDEHDDSIERKVYNRGSRNEGDENDSHADSNDHTDEAETSEGDPAFLVTSSGRIRRLSAKDFETRSRNTFSTEEDYIRHGAEHTKASLREMRNTYRRRGGEALARLDRGLGAVVRHIEEHALEDEEYDRAQEAARNAVSNSGGTPGRATSVRRSSSYATPSGSSQKQQQHPSSTRKPSMPPSLSSSSLPPASSSSSSSAWVAWGKGDDDDEGDSRRTRANRRRE